MSSVARLSHESTSISADAPPALATSALHRSRSWFDFSVKISVSSRTCIGPKAGFMTRR